MNTANKLTLLRVLMIPAFLVVLYNEAAIPGARIIALGIFALASLTDLLDGYIARHYDQTTDFGKFMDPLADKCLVVAAMLWFVEKGYMPSWALLIVIVREFAVSGLRMQAAVSGKVIAAGRSGKIKTASTMVCICVMMVMGEPLLLDHIRFLARWGGLVNLVGTWIIVATTVYSGVEYLIVNRKVFSATK